MSTENNQWLCFWCFKETAKHITPQNNKKETDSSVYQCKQLLLSLKQIDTCIEVNFFILMSIISPILWCMGYNFYEQNWLNLMACY